MHPCGLKLRLSGLEVLVGAEEFGLERFALKASVLEGVLEVLKVVGRLVVDEFDEAIVIVLQARELAGSEQRGASGEEGSDGRRGSAWGRQQV